MRIWTYIKSLNQTLLIVIITIIALISAYIWFHTNSLTKQQNDIFKFKCPSEYKKPEEYVDDFVYWISIEKKKNPKITLEELEILREEERKKHDCSPSPWVIDETTMIEIDKK